MQIILKLTTACNLKCAYCSEGNVAVNSMPSKTLKKIVDDLPPLLTYLNDTDITFLFHGGEPMIYGRDNLQEFIDYANLNLKGLNVQFLMQTNGTLIDDTWINFFKNNNISVGISLDGYPEIHDKNRRDKFNAPTAEKILINIKAMQAAGLNAGTLMVIDTTEEIDADKLFDFIRTNALYPKIHPVIACGRAADHNTVETYDNWVNLMKQLLIRSLNENSSDIIQPLDEIINAILGINPIQECSFNGTCGKNFICVYPDGVVGFCGRDNLARHLTYGNLCEKSLLELYNSENANKIRDRQLYLHEHTCKNCADWSLCHGGCAFEAVNSFGTLDAKYPQCQSRKNFIDWIRRDGIKLLKEALIREKIRRRKLINAKKSLINKIDNYGIGEVGNA